MADSRRTEAGGPGQRRRPTAPPTRALLLAGVLAGPLFLASVGAQALWRPGYDITRHPISLLARGDLGWTQVGTFVATGALVLAAAVGMRRALREAEAAAARAEAAAGGVPRAVRPTPPGSVAAPVLVGLTGLGLVMAGVFVTDPGAGFPPGSAVQAGPASTEGTVHTIGTAVALNAGALAALVMARRFSVLGRPVPALLTAACALVVLALAWWPGPGTVGPRHAGAAVVLTLWLSLTWAALLRAAVRAPGRTG